MTQEQALIPLAESSYLPQPFKVYTARQLDAIEQVKKLDEEHRFEMRVLANVLPFRVNDYVINELIDWDNIPEDPIFQLIFPQKGMLKEADFDAVAMAMRN
jgi:L-lysine 2,3-aminomutase